MASPDVKPPTRTPATRTPAGIVVDEGGGVVVVVVVTAVVVSAAVVVGVVVDDVDIGRPVGQRREPAADLGIVLALASAYSGRPMGAKTVAVGEVGLGGEIRRVAHLERRLAEAARLGFTMAIVPATTPDVPGIKLLRVHDIGEAAAPFIRASD